MKYRREIDGLRALAVLPVVLFHAGFSAFSGGFVGVDIFFVISGYLITTIIVAEMDKGSFSLLNFYERRGRRILPALFFVMLCTLPFAWLWMPPKDLKDFSQSLVAVPLFASNILFYLTSGYFDTSSELKPLLHTWSLAVEEQYYVLFPLFLMLAWKLGKKWVISILLATAIASVLIAQWLSSTQPSLTFYLLPTRAFEILIGALISLYLHNKSGNFSINPLANQAISIAGLAMIIYAILAFDKNTPSPGIPTLIPTIGAGLVLVFANSKSLAGRILGSKIFVGIGLISYSTYLWHQPLLAFARIRSVEDLTPAFLIFLSLSSIALGYLSWKYVESPFRNRSSVSFKKLVVLSFCFSLSFVAIGLLGHIKNGFESRYPLLSTIYSQGSDTLVKGNDCFLLSTNIDSFDVNKCTSNPHGKKYNVLLLGDSHSASLHEELEEYLASQDVNLGMLSAAYCLPLVESFPTKNKFAATERCEKINQKINEVIKTQNFDLILVSSFNMEWGFKNNPEKSYTTYYDDYISKIKSINSHNKVAVLGEFIVWKNGLPKIIAREIKLNNISNVKDLPKYSPDGIDKLLFSTENTLKNDLKNLGIKYISVIDDLCNDSGCMRYVETDNGSKLIAIDYGHLGIDGSRFISNNIVGPEIIGILKDKTE